MYHLRRQARWMVSVSSQLFDCNVSVFLNSRHLHISIPFRGAELSRDCSAAGLVMLSMGIVLCLIECDATHRCTRYRAHPCSRCLVPWRVAEMPCRRTNTNTRRPWKITGNGNSSVHRPQWITFLLRDVSYDIMILTC